MTYNNGGLRISIKQKTSKEEILNGMAKILTYMENNFGVEEFSNINLYLQLHIDGERQAIISNDNEMKELNHWMLEPENPHKESVKNNLGQRQTTFNKSVDFKRLENTIEAAKNKVYPNMKILSVNELENERKLNQERLMIEMRNQEIIRKRQQLEQEEKERQDKEILEKFKTMVAEKLNCPKNKLNLYTTTINYLTNQEMINKYLETKDYSHLKVLRVTYRDLENKGFKKIEIYDLENQLIHTYWDK